MTTSRPDAAPALPHRLQAALGPAYRVGAPLGQGGFGVVFLAEDLGLGRPVAIKVLRPELAAPILRERFRREAASAARLRHPHIIPIFSVGEQGDLCWLVMPHIAGETLRARLDREGRLPIGDARRILDEVAGALGAAHQAGILHRDVKPDNILLEAPLGRAILTDFGLAKSLRSDAKEAGLTTSGLVVGTPQYMSPEQAGGEPVIGPQSDLYSLGVVAYQMIAGTLPFEGVTPGAILMQQLRGPAPPLGRARPECPETLARAVDRCLMLEPGDRWQSAEELIMALGRSSVPVALAGGIVEWKSETDQPRRFRAGLVVVGVVVALATLGDVARGTVLFAPLAGILGAALVAGWYGSLWTRGYDWRTLLRPSGTSTVSPSRSAGRSLSDQARSDRAAILKALAALPRVERARWSELPPALDRAVAALERDSGDGTTPALAKDLARLRSLVVRPGGFEAPEVPELLERLTSR
jgi:hypothetical protein